MQMGKGREGRSHRWGLGGQGKPGGLLGGDDLEGTAERRGTGGPRHLSPGSMNILSLAGQLSGGVS